MIPMKPKRQRHPGVRLGEVGEISAAFSCGILCRSKVNPGSKRQKLGNKKDREVYLNPTCEFSSQLSDFTSSDSAETQKWDNCGPNLNGTCASKPRLVLGALAPKVRVTKRGRSVRCSGVMGSSWQSGVTPGMRNGNWKFYGDDGDEEAKSDIHADLCAADGSHECFDPETSSSTSNGSHQYYVDDTVAMKNWKETSADEGYCTAVEGGTVQTSFGRAAVDNVRGWLDDLGFGKYVDVFEMHGVDGEVLPLLTFEDLKEMGINAVGPRRKMFNAIQLLKD